MRIGNHQTHKGNNMHIVGNHNKISGHNNTVTGNHNKIDGNGNQVTGNHNKINGLNNSIVGNYNVKNGVREEQKRGSNTVRTFNYGAGNVVITGQNIPTDYVESISIIDGVIYKNGEQIEMKPKKRKAKKDKQVKIPTEDDAKQDVKLSDDDDHLSHGCVVCMEYNASCVFLPCGHKCVCVTCARKLGKDKTRKQVKCPECRKETKEIKRVYE